MSKIIKLRTGPHRVADLFDLNAHPELHIIWGIYVGEGCVDGHDPLEWRKVEAHAHCMTDDEWYGWICIARPNHVKTPKGSPTHALLHELAHLMAKQTSHGKRWHDILVGLGCRIEANKFYKPRVKKEKFINATSNPIREEAVRQGFIQQER